MNDVVGFIDFISTVILNVWNSFKNAGIWFLVFVAVTIVFPILRRWVITLRGGR